MCAEGDSFVCFRELQGDRELQRQSSSSSSAISLIAFSTHDHTRSTSPSVITLQTQTVKSYNSHDIVNVGETHLWNLSKEAFGSGMLARFANKRNCQLTYTHLLNSLSVIPSNATFPTKSSCWIATAGASLHDPRQDVSSSCTVSNGPSFILL